MQRFVYAALRGDWVESWWFLAPATVAVWAVLLWRASKAFGGDA